MLASVALGDRSVTELAEPFDMSLAAVSKHLKVLERAGLVSRTREGRVHRLKLDAGPLKDAAMWISVYREFWESQLDSLGAYLSKLDEQEPQTSKDDPSTNE